MKSGRQCDMIVLVAVAFFWRRSKPWSAKANLSVLPERFVVLDLETTGLDAGKHEITEFGAIRMNRDSTNHETFQSLVKPSMKVPKQITALTGNRVSCALKMARRAWPDRSSYRLADLARGGNLKTSNAHRAQANAERALVVHAAAAAKLRSHH